MLNLNPPSSVVNPDVDSLCDHVNEIAIEGEEAGAGDQVVVAPPPLSSLTVPSPMETSDEECKTPKGEEYKIPEITSCPPAPKRPKNTRNLPAEVFFVIDNMPKLDDDDEDDDDVVAPSEININHNV